MREKGFDVSITVDGQSKHIVQHIEPLGSHVDKTVFEIQIAVSETGILPVIVDGRKNIIIMHGVPKKMKARFEPFKVRKDIPQHGTGDHASTHYPENNIRLILWGDKGNFSVLECAVVIQNNIAFYTRQQSYADRCFLQNGNIVCPRFEAPWANRPWPQLAQLLKPGFFNEALPSIETWQPEEPLLQNLKAKEGRVLWFNCAMGYGAVQLVDGSTARIHWKNIATIENNFRSLSPGDLVTYERIATIGQGAGTSFTKDCLGVMNSFVKNDPSAALK